MIGAALLLLAAEPAIATPPPAVPVAAATGFAPPVDQPMIYRVTTRRLSRDGSIASYVQTYTLQWERVGRGVQLVATLNKVESDARPELAQAFGRLLQPLVDQPITFLVASDGRRVDLVDPEGLWQRVIAQAQTMAAAAEQPEAKQLAQMLAALPPEEREKLATSDVRALVAPANAEIPVPPATGVTVRQDGNLRMITRTEKSYVASGAGGMRPIEVDASWTVDTATGLLVGERRQSWVAEPDGSGRKLVEEHVRTLENPAPS